ncbi:hypothetical protein GW17_00055833 [Ensete ventricosum]|nr:hypothetical protein GW17_00055833 [Ensete ventricosum]
MLRSYVEMVTLNLLRDGQPMITLYAKGSLTTMKGIINVLVLSSSPKVMGKVAMPIGVIASLVNPTKFKVMGARSLLVIPSFWKASNYSMSVEFLVSFMMRLTRAFAIRAEITRASSWSKYYSSPDSKVISGSHCILGLFGTLVRA